MEAMKQDSPGNHIAAQRGREPADAHFRRLGRTASASGAGSQGAPASLDQDVARSGCTFEVYRADEVRMTSTQFGGGDWHWRLSDGDGAILLDTGGYASESECVSAVAILQESAGLARLCQGSRA